MQTAEIKPPTKSWNRIDGVDLLRGLAIFFVLMNHVNMQMLFAKVPYTKGLPHQLVSSLVWNGQYGVQIFFAVSGFLITSTSIRRWGSLGSVQPGKFYVIRFARIAPLLLLLLAVLSGLDLAHVKHFVVGAKQGGLGNALLAALTFRINVLEATRGYLPGNWDILWSLSVEEMFYLFFPLVCRTLGRRAKLLSVVLLGFVAAGPFARTLLTHGNEVWQEYSYLGAMDAIALGCLTALLLSGRSFSKASVRVSALLGTILLVFVLCFSVKAEALGLERTGLDMTILAVGACLLIAAATSSGWRAPSVIRPVLWLGQRSYEVYLSHMFIVIGLFGLYISRGTPVKAAPLVFVTTIAVAAALGDLVVRIYSEPLNRLIRKRFDDDARHLGAVRQPSSVMPNL